NSGHLQALNLWFPKIQQVLGNQDASPNVTARAVLMYDLILNKPLYEKNPRLRVPMASLTKIMTAIIALENPKPDDQYIVHGENLVGEDSMGLDAGEV